MTGVEHDAGGRVYEPSADCERGGTNARALVLGPSLVVRGTWRGRVTVGADVELKVKVGTRTYRP